MSDRERIVFATIDVTDVPVATAGRVQELHALIVEARTRAVAAERALADTTQWLNAANEVIEEQRALIADTEKALAEAREEIERTQDAWDSEVQGHVECDNKHLARIAVLESDLATARAQITELQAANVALRQTVESIKSTFDAAATHFRNKNLGGMHVPFHGDFSNVPPSAVTRMEWWSRVFADALSTPNPGAPILAALKEAREALDFSPPVPSHPEEGCECFGCENFDRYRAVLAKIREVLGE